MTDKVFSPLPVGPLPPVISQEVTDEEKHRATHNITKAVNAAHVGEGFESMSFSLIAISIALHAIWEILRKQDTITSGSGEIRISRKGIEELKRRASELDPDMPEKEETE